MLSQRGRDQLASYGLASRSQEIELANLESDSNDLINFEMLSGLTTAGLRFDWLCKQFQNRTASHIR